MVDLPDRVRIVDEHQAADLRLVGLPVVVVLDQRGRFAGFVITHDVGASAVEVDIRIVPFGDLVRGGGAILEDQREASAHAVQEVGIGLCQREDHRVIAIRRHLEVAQQAGRCRLVLDQPVEREDHIRRCKRRSIMERGVIDQIEGVGQAIIADGPVGRQVRGKCAVGQHIDQVIINMAVEKNGRVAGGAGRVEIIFRGIDADAQYTVLGIRRAHDDCQHEGRQQHRGDTS